MMTRVPQLQAKTPRAWRSFSNSSKVAIQAGLYSCLEGLIAIQWCKPSRLWGEMKRTGIFAMKGIGKSFTVFKSEAPFSRYGRSKFRGHQLPARAV